MGHPLLAGQGDIAGESTRDCTNFVAVDDIHKVYLLCYHGSLICFPVIS